MKKIKDIIEKNTIIGNLVKQVKRKTLQSVGRLFNARMGRKKSGHVIILNRRTPHPPFNFENIVEDAMNEILNNSSNEEKK